MRKPLGYKSIGGVLAPPAVISMPFSTGPSISADKRGVGAMKALLPKPESSFDIIPSSS
jgi:hypothetical protein